MKNSKIEWTDHTFNPWWGCAKVSPACRNCYAEALSKRFGLGEWGDGGKREFFSDDNWSLPKRWNRSARAARRRYRVFCASMADVFEDRRDLDPWRERLWGLIDQTPALDWLLLTKRIDRAGALVPWRGAWPANVWIGATVETQEWAERRVPELVALPARIRFVSCEPLLGWIDLARWLGDGGLGWVIAGGETGRRARPSDPAWFLELRDQCGAAGVPFFFKQWGSRGPTGRTLDGVVWDQLPALS